MNPPSYIIIRKPSLEELESGVCAAIAIGYTPAGGPFPACINSFAQALVIPAPPRSHHKKKPD